MFWRNPGLKIEPHNSQADLQHKTFFALRAQPDVKGETP